MPITMTRERNNVCRITVSGVLKTSEFDDCQRWLAGEISQHGTVRLLVLLVGFEGWASSPGWGDLSFYVKHGDSIERIAIVGDGKWRSEALMFAAADLRRAPVQFFAENALEDATAWLTA